jgi:hypothetical protein
MKAKSIIIISIILCINLACGQSSKSRISSNDGILKVATTNNFSSFYDLTKALPKGYKKDGSIDYTTYLQNAINKYQKVLMPNFPIATSGLILRSKSEIFFQENSLLKLIPTKKSRYEILKLHGLNNVKIYNPKLIGDRENHIGNSGEWGYGIDIRGSQNISIYNPMISNCWGDGIIISNSSLGVNSSKKLLSTANIVISGGVLDYNRRNGLTIIEGNKILIENLLIKNTMGTSPQAALMIEPDNSAHEINNIIIRNITTINNPRSFAVNLNNFMDANSNKKINVSVSNYKVKNSNTAIFASGFENVGQTKNKKKILGEINIENLSVERTNSAFENRNGFNLYPTINVINPKITDKNGRAISRSGYGTSLKDKKGFIFK